MSNTYFCLLIVIRFDLNDLIKIGKENVPVQENQKQKLAFICITAYVVKIEALQVHHKISFNVSIFRILCYSTFA
jgi:hypothetical protein